MTPTIATLRPRVYPNDAQLRRKYLPHGALDHPAKMRIGLLLDLVRRYTGPGDWIIDPFGGQGTTLLAILPPGPRNVIACELEPDKAGMVGANLVHLRGLFDGGMEPLGDACVIGGDSRRLHTYAPLMGNVVMGSPPYPDARAGWRTGGVTEIFDEMHIGKIQRQENIRYGSTEGQIGGMRVGHANAVIGSPPYETTAKRNRTNEGYAQNNPERERRYGGSASRHVDGYGDTDGQIGAMDRDTYCQACFDVYHSCRRVTLPGGVMVMVTGNYVKGGEIQDVAALTIQLAEKAGWRLVERWVHAKSHVSFWRILHAQQGKPIVDTEDVLVFANGAAPDRRFTDLPPTNLRPFELQVAKRKAEQLVFPL